jgi:hypothetical protein
MSGLITTCKVGDVVRTGEEGPWIITNGERSVSAETRAEGPASEARQRARRELGNHEAKDFLHMAAMLRAGCKVEITPQGWIASRP